MTLWPRFVVLFLLLLASSGLAQQQSTPQSPPATETKQSERRPQFRGGANLVRLDAYVTADGVPVTDLTLADFEVLEDNVPQRVETFELIRPREPGPQTERREPNTAAESREMALAPEARLFVLFFDVWHVPIGGSFRARQPLINFLDRAIGQDDRCG